MSFSLSWSSRTDFPWTCNPVIEEMVWVGTEWKGPKEARKGRGQMWTLS